MTQLAPLRFRSHPLIRGGHLQTLATTFFHSPELESSTQRHQVCLGDGDQLVMHDDCPPGWSAAQPRLLMIHGLCGSHRTSYMARLATRFYQRQVRVFRLDMRGCGAGFELAQHLNHASRSGDILRAAEKVVELTGAGPFWIIGISLGAGQLLKLLGELAQGQLPSSSHVQIHRAAAVAPPIDLLGCAQHMQRLYMRPYNRYFISYLLKQIPPQLAQSSAFQQLDLRRRPRTMYELDDRITAPLSGYQSAQDYYTRSTADQFTAGIETETLVLAAQDDPIVPVGGFKRAEWSPSTTLEIVPGGGHVAFLASGRPRFWMDQRLEHWFFS